MLFSVLLIIVHFIFPHWNSTVDSSLNLNNSWTVFSKKRSSLRAITEKSFKIGLSWDDTLHFQWETAVACLVLAEDMTKCWMERKNGEGKTDQYCSGNKVEKVIYLTLIRCLGSRAGPASLLLTFKPECTHKR